MPLSAGIWPEWFDGWKRVSAAPIALTDRAIWDEYGLEASEEATYEKAGGKFTGSAWRVKDSTSAYAVHQWMQPKGKVAPGMGQLGLETESGLFVIQGNYILRFDGFKPVADSVNQLSVTLPRLDRAPLPNLGDFMPKAGLIAGSERYILGPVTLAKWEPKISPSQAAFSLAAEAQVARYKTPDGEMQLTVFNYPTPQIARERTAEMQKVAGVAVKRSGPLVAVVSNPVSADAAERLLAQLKYQANVTWNDRIPAKDENWGSILHSIAMLTLVLLGFCVSAGLLFGGGKILARKLRRGAPASDEMVVLGLQDR